MTSRLREARVAALLGHRIEQRGDELEELVSKAASLFAESISEQTRLDYRRRWAKWSRWCERQGLDPLGSPPEAVMLFLSDHVGAGDVALGTLRSYMAAINRVHVEAGLQPPGEDPAMRIFLRSLSRVAPRRPEGEEITPLRIERLREVCRHLDGHGPDPVELRDRAVLAMHRAGVGDGEIARLEWADVAIGATRARLLLRAVRRGRQDRQVIIRAASDAARCGVHALSSWRDVAGEQVPWVVTRTDPMGSRAAQQWRSRDVFRVRRSRCDSLGTGGKPASPGQAISLLGGVPASVLRDKALLLVGFAGAFRRPDIVDFTWDDVTMAESGVILRLRRSKTDRLGHGVDVGIPRGTSATTDPVAALLAWRGRVERQLGSSAIGELPCFTVVGRAGRIGVTPLTTTAVSVMIRRRMAEAGIPGRWSGRSLRRGFISTAADMGIRLEDIARGSRHQTLDSLIRYIGTEDPFRDNPAGLIGL